MITKANRKYNLNMMTMQSFHCFHPLWAWGIFHETYHFGLLPCIWVCMLDGREPQLDPSWCHQQRCSWPPSWKYPEHSLLEPDWWVWEWEMQIQNISNGLQWNQRATILMVFYFTSNIVLNRSRSTSWFKYLAPFLQFSFLMPRSTDVKLKTRG